MFPFEEVIMDFLRIDMPLTQEHIMQWINAPASRERKLEFSILTYVSSGVCCIKTFRLV